MGKMKQYWFNSGLYEDEDFQQYIHDAQEQEYLENRHLLNLSTEGANNLLDSVQLEEQLNLNWEASFIELPF